MYFIGSCCQGSLAEWLVDHPVMLGGMLPMVLQALARPELSVSSVSTLKRICRECRHDLGSFTQDILTVCQVLHVTSDGWGNYIDTSNNNVSLDRMCWLKVSIRWVSIEIKVSEEAMCDCIFSMCRAASACGSCRLWASCFPLCQPKRSWENCTLSSVLISSRWTVWPSKR